MGRAAGVANSRDPQPRRRSSWRYRGLGARGNAARPRPATSRAGGPRIRRPPVHAIDVAHDRNAVERGLARGCRQQSRWSEFDISRSLVSCCDGSAITKFYRSKMPPRCTAKARQCTTASARTAITCSAGTSTSTRSAAMASASQPLALGRDNGRSLRRANSRPLQYRPTESDRRDVQCDGCARRDRPIARRSRQCRTRPLRGASARRHIGSAGCLSGRRMGQPVCAPATSSGGGCAADPMTAHLERLP